MPAVAHQSSQVKTYSPSPIEAARLRARVLPHETDPARLFAFFKPLRLEQGCVLRAYRYVSGEDSHGTVCAVTPEGEDRRFTKYIRGNGSPRSYLLASILTRELLEFGANRHGRWWSLERLIDCPPAGDWKWTEEPPRTWSPVVQVTATIVTVTFHTHSTAELERIITYTDTYERGQYSFVTDGAVIAYQPTISGGWIRPRSS